MEETIKMSSEALTENTNGGGSYKKERQSNFELLRIIAMLMIIGSHLHFGTMPIVKSFGQVGVMLFMLVSSYFLYNKKFKLTTVLRVIFDCILYSFLAYFVDAFYLLFRYKVNTFSFYMFVRQLFLFLTTNYWFIPNYILIYLIFPFLNLIAQKLNKKQFTYFLALIIGSICLISQLEGIEFNYWVVEVAFNFGWYVMVYFIGCYIRKYSDAKSLSSKLVAVVGLAFCLLVHIGSYYIRYNGRELRFILRNDYNLVFLCIFIFLLFKNLNIKQNKFINTVASTTLGVYLIHESGVFATRVLDKLEELEKLWPRQCGELVGVGFIVAIFVCCSVIDLVVKYLVEKPVFKFLDKKCGKLFDKVNNFYPYEKAEPEVLTDSQQNSAWKFWEYIFASLILYIFSNYLCMVFVTRLYNYLLPLYLFMFGVYVGSSFLIKFLIRRKRQR